MKRDYYKLSKVLWTNYYRDVEGIIIKYLTVDEVKSRLENNGEIWIKVG